MELCVDENSIWFFNSIAFQKETLKRLSWMPRDLQKRQIENSAFLRRNTNTKYFEQCSCAARMTRTKRDVSVGIHSSSHGHEIMSESTLPGPLGTKQRALRLLIDSHFPILQIKSAKNSVRP